MCCGQWWARAMNLPPICEEECFESALGMIYNYNLKKFNNGKYGLFYLFNYFFFLYF